MSSLLHYLRVVREANTPISTASTLSETGMLTPEEWVAAGNGLVSRNPLFQWKAAATSMSVAHLPPDKQYLVATKLPSYTRVADLQEVEQQVHHVSLLSGLEGDDGYCLPLSGHKCKEDGNKEEEEDIVMVYGEDESDSKIGEKAAVTVTMRGQGHHDGTAGHERFYTLCITYDKFYRTPRVFFYGHDRNGSSLSDEEIAADVYYEYRRVVSMEPMPHSGSQMMRIHPCQHAKAMHNVIKTLVESDPDYEPKVEHYLLVFLKIISCVIPTIEYDYGG